MKILDFYADWCVPCGQMKPTIESLEKDFDVEKINIDEQSDVAQAHDVMSIPTLIITKDNEEIKRFSGITPEKEIRDFISGL